LNCSGNPLLPGPAGEVHRTVTTETIRLSGLLGIRRVVMMSGCPGGEGDKNANWVTTAWPPEAARVLDAQWSEQLVLYWRGLVAEAADAGVERLCLELHGQQNVFNVRTLFRLRDAVGPVVGANLDPSHLFWMGADPLAAVAALGDAIYHVHAKDNPDQPGRGLGARSDRRDPDGATGRTRVVVCDAWRWAWRGVVACVLLGVAGGWVRRRALGRA
jgi:sugar phosphate isomerase/epimerase